MKDLPHHMKKLNRRIVRSMHREEMEAEQLPEIPNWPVTKSQKRKQAKQKMKTETLARPSSDLTPEQRNKIMKGGRKGRVPVFDQNKGTAKRARPSKKKTPRI